MLNARFVKALSAVALFNGVLYLAILQDSVAASDIADARKYTDDLKKSKDTKVRVIALQELGKLAVIQKGLVSDALPDIYKSIEDKDAGVRAAAATCLGQCDEPTDKAVPALMKLLKDDKEDSVKIGAAKGLAAMGPEAKAALPTLRELAADKKSAVGKVAITAVKAISGKK
ncbi:MAG TPA: HEAT repeat domain-containing protein [Gemmata sp.]|jgi:HEAT repeat protein|nr:HEAT repeat domain-containing protein [Gemmata sp.]